jgi:hypothetical protein
VTCQPRVGRRYWTRPMLRQARPPAPSVKACRHLVGRHRIAFQLSVHPGRPVTWGRYNYLRRLWEKRAPYTARHYEQCCAAVPVLILSVRPCKEGWTAPVTSSPAVSFGRLEPRVRLQRLSNPCFSPHEACVLAPLGSRPAEPQYPRACRRSAVHHCRSRLRAGPSPD